MGSVNIFAGGYGSGKTEIALNFALDIAAGAENVVLADLDLVNPYFVSRVFRERLEAEDIRLLAPDGVLAFGDVPQLPAYLIREMHRDNNLLIDIAGDDAGGVVLGYLNRHLAERSPFHLWLVINPYRPFAQDLQSITELVELLQGTSRMCFNGIISNPNLIEETDVDVIRRGHQQVMTYASSLQIPIGYLTVREDFYDQLYPEFGAILKPIKLLTRPEWMQDG